MSPSHHGNTNPPPKISTIAPTNYVNSNPPTFAPSKIGDTNGPTFVPTSPPMRPRVNTLQEGNTIYSTLTDAAVDGYVVYTSNNCNSQQQPWIALSPDWMIAPDTIISRAVARAHSWSSNYVIFSNGGCEIASSSSGIVGNCGTITISSRNGNEYRAGNGIDSCYYRILVQQ